MRLLPPPLLNLCDEGNDGMKWWGIFNAIKGEGRDSISDGGGGQKGYDSERRFIYFFSVLQLRNQELMASHKKCHYYYLLRTFLLRVPSIFFSGSRQNLDLTFLLSWPPQL